MAETQGKQAMRIDWRALRTRLEQSQQIDDGTLDLQAIFRDRARVLAKPQQSSTAARGIEHLRFSVSGVRFAVPLMDVHCLMAPGPVTRIPGARATLAHVIHVDGRLVSVVDLAPLIGHGAVTIEELRQSRMLLLQQATRTLAIPVGKILEVSRIDTSKLTPPPKGTWTTEASRGVTADLTNVIDVSRLMDRLRSVADVNSKETEQ